jgi:DNA-binding NarL/FixJ family response regulator
MMPIRILLADDHHMIRQGLRVLLEREPDFSVVGEATDGHEALALTDKLNPNIVVMDVCMPTLNGVDATRKIHADHPNIRVVVLSAYSERNRVAEALFAGACGYLLKSSAFEELITAVRTVISGKTYLGSGVSNAALDQDLAKSNGHGALSGREREVLQLLAEGKAMKEAAVALHVSVKTIETHRRSIMEKLELYSIAELTKHAIREGLTTLDG